MMEDFDGYHLECLGLTPGAIEQAIMDAQADIAITYLPIPNPNLDILKITTIEMGIFGVKNKFQNNDFQDLEFVAPNKKVFGTPSKVKGLDGWPDHEIPRNVRYNVALMETALDLCRRGKCVGYFPKFVISLHNESVKPKYELKEIVPPKKLKSKKQNVYMIKRKK